MHPTYIESTLSTPASLTASRALSTKMSRSDFSQSSPHFIIPTPITATSLISCSPVQQVPIHKIVASYTTDYSPLRIFPRYFV
jgi:hypothetical protein